MTFGVSGIAYNGYGRFVPRWLASIARQRRKPDQVVLVLAGSNPGLPLYYEIPDWVTVIETELQPHGDLHAIGIEALKTDWVMYFSVDDTFLPKAFKEYEKFLHLYQSTDVLLTSWIERKADTRPRLKRSAVPKTAGAMGRGFICGHCLFKKKDWKTNRWPPGCDFPALFLVPKMVENNKKFLRLDTPTWEYLRRRTSRQGTLPHKKRKQAREESKDSLRRINEHYGN